MKLEKRFLVIALIAIALAIPVALAMQHRAHQLKIEKSQNSNLHIQLDKSQKDLQLKSTQLEQVQQQKVDEQKKNEDLQKQLQSKRDTANTLAAQARKAPVALSVSSGNCESYRGIVAQYDWNVDTALAVMNAESGCNSGADNPHDGHPTCYGSRGLFGIGCDSTGNYAGMFDASANIAQAHALYSSRGWQPWGATTCRVKVSCG